MGGFAAGKIGFSPPAPFCLTSSKDLFPKFILIGIGVQNAPDFHQSRRVYYRLDESGRPYLVHSNQTPEYRCDNAARTIRWYLYDGLSSVLGAVDPSGTVTSSRKYDVYGLVRGGTNSGGSSSHKFVGSLGHPSEDRIGFVYMRARYYDPVVGRFVSEDPSLKGLNWYIYCGGNPTSRVDASGKEWSLAGLMVALEDYLNADTAEDSNDLKLLDNLRDAVEKLRSSQFSERTWEIANSARHMMEEWTEEGLKAEFAKAGVSLLNPVTIAQAQEVPYELYIYTFDGIIY